MGYAGTVSPSTFYRSSEKRSLEGRDLIMIANIKYEDVDYYDQLEEDETTIGLPEKINFNEFIKDFREYLRFFLQGYEIKDVIDDEELFKENFPCLSIDEARYFIKVRENGLTANSVVTEFLIKYPQYKSDYCGNTSHYIVFNEYGLKIDGKAVVENSI